MPATQPAPSKPDMWAHQYDQQSNQVVCKLGPDTAAPTSA